MLTRNTRAKNSKKKEAIPFFWANTCRYLRSNHNFTLSLPIEIDCFRKIQGKRTKHRLGIPEQSPNTLQPKHPIVPRFFCK